MHHLSMHALRVGRRHASGCTWVGGGAQLRTYPSSPVCQQQPQSTRATPRESAAASASAAHNHRHMYPPARPLSKPALASASPAETSASGCWMHAARGACCGRGCVRCGGDAPGVMMGCAHTHLSPSGSHGPPNPKPQRAAHAPRWVRAELEHAFGGQSPLRRTSVQCTTSALLHGRGTEEVNVRNNPCTCRVAHRALLAGTHAWSSLYTSAMAHPNAPTALLTAIKLISAAANTAALSSNGTSASTSLTVTACRQAASHFHAAPSSSYFCARWGASVTPQ